MRLIVSALCRINVHIVYVDYQHRMYIPMNKMFEKYREEQGRTEKDKQTICQKV